MLSEYDFKQVVKNTNLLAFDLIIQNNNNEIFLAERNNSPAKGYYFVPGGRVFKNENLNSALERTLNDEVGLKLNDFGSITHKGLYEHIYDDNVFSDFNFNTHYIVYAIELKYLGTGKIVLDQQHHEYKFMKIHELLDSDVVHEFTKNYFINLPSNKLVLS
jgi:colanic acid biosynthesis protein WcaH